MITIIKLALARYVHRPMSTLLSIILFTIGVAIISLIVKSEWYLQNNYKQNLAGIDLVVGAKGSPLQLILSSVLHVDAPTGNIPLEEVHKIENNPLVKKTIPIALGDNYKGFRIVGTNTDYVELYNAQLNEGEMFSKPLEAVVGANVAKESGLKLQDNFVGAHGFMHQGHSHDEFEYSVTGVLKPTGTIIDNLVLTPVESVWLVHSHIEEHQHDEEVHDTEHNHHEHVHENHNKKSEDKHLHEAAIDEILHKIENGEEISEEELHIYNKHKGILTEKEHHPEKEITSLLVFYQNPMAVARLPRMINENTTLQAASPALEFNRLLSLLGYGITVLENIGMDNNYYFGD
jgi:putative ABC transport system permease protein